MLYHIQFKAIADRLNVNPAPIKRYWIIIIAKIIKTFGIQTRSPENIKTSFPDIALHPESKTQNFGGAVHMWYQRVAMK